MAGQRLNGPDVQWWPLGVVASGVAAVLMLILLTSQQRNEINSLRAAVETTSVQRLQSTSRERLVGSQVIASGSQSSTGFFEASDHALEGIDVIWVFDPARCPACELEVPRWNRSILGEYPAGLVILTGVSGPEASEVAARIGIRTSYVADEAAVLARELGLYFDSSFLILNDDKRVLHAEFHTGYSECARDVLALARELVGPWSSHSLTPGQ